MHIINTEHCHESLFPSDVHKAVAIDVYVKKSTALRLLKITRITSSPTKTHDVKQFFVHDSGLQD